MEIWAGIFQGRFLLLLTNDFPMNMRDFLDAGICALSYVHEFI